MDQNWKPFIVQFFVDQNCKPFIVQFFWQKLQTFQWHTITQTLHTPKRPIELWSQLQNQLFTFIILFCCLLLHITQCETLVNTHLRTNISSLHQNSHMLWNKHLTHHQHICLNHSCYYWSNTYAWTILVTGDLQGLFDDDNDNFSHQRSSQSCTSDSLSTTFTYLSLTIHWYSKGIHHNATLVKPQHYHNTTTQHPLLTKHLICHAKHHHWRSRATPSPCWSNITNHRSPPYATTKTYL